MLGPDWTNLSVVTQLLLSPPTHSWYQTPLEWRFGAEWSDVGATTREEVEVREAIGWAEGGTACIEKTCNDQQADDDGEVGGVVHCGQQWMRACWATSLCWAGNKAAKGKLIGP
jgi:hypothetical protein